MTDNADKHEAWADTIRVVDILVNSAKRTHTYDPSVAILATTGHAFPIEAPRERFSDEKLSLPAEIARKDLLPIDLLYGRYLPESRTVEIFLSQIESHAPSFGATFGQLLRIIRLHEYAHATLHLGVSVHAVTTILNQFSESQETVTDFLVRRTNAFCAIDDAAHEFLAQAITYGCIMQEKDGGAAELLNIFEALEEKQPNHYQVPAEVKAIAHHVDWSLVLDAARGDISAHREPDFSMHAGLLALVRQLALPLEATTPKREWCVELEDSATAVRELKQALTNADATSQGQSASQEAPEFLVDRYAGLKIEVFANEHPPPHFRVKCSGETANFTISDCTQLNGNLARHVRTIRKWHRRYKTDLINAWNKARPSDCSVGEYRE